VNETQARVISDVILAAGGVLYRQASAGDEILIVHRKRYGDWTLPKGKLQSGESFMAAALREIEEETGCTVRPEKYLGAIGYEVNGKPKAVLFWRVSLVAQKEIEDHEEVAEVVWMPLKKAVQRLTHPDERALLLRARKEYVVSASARASTSPSPELSKSSSPGRPHSWFWPPQGDYERLQREFQCFSVELALLEEQTQQPDKSWADAAHQQLQNVAHYLESKDVAGGWVCLHAARRHAIYGLGTADLQIQASILREEATKFSSWRSKAMQTVLGDKSATVTVDQVVNAMALRDEYFSNQYHKIWLMANQLFILLILSGFGLVLFIPFVVYFSCHPESQTVATWGYQMVTAVLFFGLLGAAFSAAASLMSATEARIPERVGNYFVTITRALFGAGAGLAGYALYHSKLLDIRIGSGGADTGPAAALAMSFLFGFAGERLIAGILLGKFGQSKT